MKVWETEIFGRKLAIEHGKMAKQAHGSVLLKYGKSAILVTATASKEAKDGVDFLPLTVEFQEKFYAVGKIPGGFLKREGRPSSEAILSSRLIDRPIRPLFPKDFHNEIQVIVTALSMDTDDSIETWGITGASFALNLSPIPFDGMVAGVRVGYVNGEFIVFPTQEELKNSKMDIVVAGTKEAITMVEGESLEVSEEEMVKALLFAHDAIKQIIEFQESVVSEFNIEKWEVTPPEYPEEFVKDFESLIDDNELKSRILVKGKKDRDDAIDSYRKELLEKFQTDYIEKWDNETFDKYKRFILEAFDEKIKKLMRKMIIEENTRADGRKIDEIRPITCEIGLFDKTHGSALFTRGETQSLGIVTLGEPMDVQIIDTVFEEGERRFMLHYNFPPFSTGEVKGLRLSRREIGHGHLAERALKNLIPSEEEFPYIIRVVSEVLESNGSSSMATVCSGSLALMDAGVPMKKHVAGVAMGLIFEEDKFVVLTDILGMEDHLGDMDFKVTGTKDGITAFQMDVKVAGVNEEVLKEALERARIARLHILDIMYNTIPEPKKELSPYAPLIKTTVVPIDKISDVIGPGGRVIKGISKEFEVEVSINDETGLTKVSGFNVENINNAISYIQNLIKEVKQGEIFEGKVSRIENYGVFIEIAPGKVGLLHMSNLGNDAKEILNNIKIGDILKVEIVSIDDNGRIQLKKFGVETPHKKSRRSYHSKKTGEDNDQKENSK
ncbi:polyribonucleotide nucleotidyltransferase [Marinitoga sp. 38H-ov]|uniref:polyribonucleotide nucleotidyltransferase n=1 Tax=Marinitoga sp. 38H-ov TaxID=1755814 RepID=UPI0013ED8418|nr:polyribonucleotide nucleotidyltransferase [Marinitoga sp. 38H-ov]KAF2955683.1 polyribonucleotide nucleotidyltransferase [Marinitoga sp. 38H-ov]